MQVDAIILGCGYNGLSIVQELASYGLKCFFFDTKKGVAGHTNKAKFVQCPDVTTNVSGFSTFLENFCKHSSVKPVIYPTHDKWATALAKSKKKLTNIALPVVSDLHVVQTILDKAKFSELGIKQGYLTPKAYSCAELLKADDVFYPIVAKPNFRQISSDCQSSEELEIALNQRRFKLLYSIQDVSDFFKENKKYLDSIVFQQYVAGLCNQMVTVGVYANKNSDVIGLFSGRKVRGYPADYGDCLFGETYQIPPHIIGLVKRITLEIGIQGIAEFEFKIDEYSGNYFLIEVNPRSWSWIGITPYCGLSLPKMAYDDLNGKRAKYKDSCQLLNGEVCYGFIYSDLLSLIRNQDNPFQANFSSIVRSYLKKRTITAEFHKGDWTIPFWGLLAIVKSTLRIYFRG